ncbi:hypothetical protein D3C80_681150 [compost metagenome]
MVLEQQHILTAGVLGEGVDHLGDHLLHAAQVRVFPDLKVFADLERDEEDMPLVPGQGLEQGAIAPSVLPLHQAPSHPAPGLLIEAPGPVIDEMGVAPVQQVLVDVVAAGIPGPAGEGLAYLQLRLIRRRPCHLGQRVTLGIEGAEGIDAPLLQGHEVGTQVTLLHGPDADFFQLADADGLLMVVTAITVTDEAVDAMALDEAAKEGVPGIRLAGEAFAMAHAAPALIPPVEMDLVDLVAGVGKRLAEGLKEGAQRSLQQQNLHVRLISSTGEGRGVAAGSVPDNSA